LSTKSSRKKSKKNRAKVTTAQSDYSEIDYSIRDVTRTDDDQLPGKFQEVSTQTAEVDNLPGHTLILRMIIMLNISIMFDCI